MGISFTGGREYVIERLDLKPKIKPANSSWFYFYVYLEVLDVFLCELLEKIKNLKIIASSSS